MNLAKYIDHTNLKPEATPQDINRLIDEAKTYHFASVCINPCYVGYAKKKLQDSDVKVCTVIGFPLGANTSAVKAFETAEAIRQGADEIDMVIAIGALKAGLYQEVQQDIEAVVKASQGHLVKVILETCLLSREEIVKACQLAMAAGAQFVKTSTGFNKHGATVEDVALMKATVGEKMMVKASGGIRTLQDALQMIEAGASRLGTSSGVMLVNRS
ncbi:MAG TPA: deoxyribose-phosphate aldolase [Candidatus Fimiplasma intestinipullorum]|uniref:Deoxyribose-phosphate aldolase n=1 Tax=Candidatus Fimiplasma intestinipullorum TaxID=2840825 RepID=A0A9D1L0R2_9FIRM|nr:deoxyribose-phosphate aldolase [Candidatus Fimiplasma intestinipullorum]